MRQIRKVLFNSHNAFSRQVRALYSSQIYSLLCLFRQSNMFSANSAIFISAKRGRKIQSVITWDRWFSFSGNFFALSITPSLGLKVMSFHYTKIVHNVLRQKNPLKIDQTLAYKQLQGIPCYPTFNSGRQVAGHFFYYLIEMNKNTAWFLAPYPSIVGGK